MSIFLSLNWHSLKEEIWLKMEESEYVFPELYMELMRVYLNVMKDEFFPLDDISTVESYDERRRIEEKKELFEDLETKAADLDLVRDTFFNLPILPNEKKAVKIVENIFESLYEYNENLAEEYVDLLKLFLLKYNIRYSICDPCKLSLTPEGYLATEFNYIKYLSQGVRAKEEIIEMIENSLNNIENLNEENHCIDQSIKLIENFLLEKTVEDIPEQNRSLSYMINRCGDLFPTESVRESLKNYYSFSNQYPNIRHIGDERHRIRNLNKSDGLLAISLAIAYSAFLTQNYEDVYYGEYIKPEGGE